MIIKSLSLKNFRNHKFKSFQFEKGINVITGPNGAGKTNIVEAIYYLSLARSFRVNEEENLIQKGYEQTEVSAEVQEGPISHKISVTLNKNGRKVLINAKPIKKLTELSKRVNVVLFEPKDVLLFRGTPKVRRNFLDVSISKKSDSYLDYLSRYEKVLIERNELLKSEKIDPILLETNTEMLIKLEAPIITYRQLYVKDINDILNIIARALAHEELKFELRYYPFTTFNDEFESNAKKAYLECEESDIKHKATSIGIHREDFKMLLNGRDIAEYGSQGENRLAALALKLSPYFLIEDEDKKPIVVLDDVMSELDEKHQQLLIQFIKQFEQVFITGTRLKIDGAKYHPINKKLLQEDF